MIEKKKIERIPVLPAKAKGRDEYIGRVRMHKDTIIMDVYEAMGVMCPEGEEKDAQIKFRWVCDKKNYYTYQFLNNTWNHRGIRYAIHGYVSYGRLDIRLDKESERIARIFIGDCRNKLNYFNDNPVGWLLAMEEDIRQQRWERKEENRKDRIVERLGSQKPLPGDWERWLKTNVYKEERYLFYDGKKRKTGICAYCGEKVALDGEQRFNGYGKCPACGSRIQYKTIKKTVQKTDRKKAVYIQKIDGGFMVRYFNTIKTSSPLYGENYRSYEVAMETYRGGKRWNDYCYRSGVFGEMYWDDRKRLEMGGWEPEGYLYTKNVKMVVRDTVLRYAPLAEWMKHEKKEIPVGYFIRKYPTSQFLEFFVKIGLYRLTTEYVRRDYKWTGQTPNEILKINKQRINRLIRMDGGLIALEWLRYEEREGLKIPDDTILWLQDSRLTPNSCRSILGSIGSVVRMVRYIARQDVPPADFLRTWADYLRMAADEGMDTMDDIVRFPKNLRARHDYLVRLGEQSEDKKRLEKYAALDKRIAERLPEAGRYYWESEDYVIVPAAKCKELMTESRTLHHCVGMNDRYMNKMAAGESWILFLRKREALDTPYYTIEIDMGNDEILQWYSEYDRKPDADRIRKILNLFRRSLEKRKRVRVPVRIPA